MKHRFYKDKCRSNLLVFFLFIALLTNAQKNNSYSSISTTYNQIFYKFSDYYISKYNSGFNVIYTENYNKFRFSIGFGFSSKRYQTSEMSLSLPSFYKKYSLPVYNFPISSTYFVFNNPKNQIGINIGLSLNKSIYYYYTEFNNDVEITSRYKSGSIGVSYCFGLIYRHYIRKNLSLNFNPQFFLTNINENDYYNKTSPLFGTYASKSSFFFNIGLEYFFNKSFARQFLNQNKSAL